MNNVRNFDQNVICYTNLANFENFYKDQEDSVLICSVYPVHMKEKNLHVKLFSTLKLVSFPCDS